MLVLLCVAVIVADLQSWLGELGPGFGAVSPLSGDLSQRRYFRVSCDDGSRLLAAHYPESLRPSMERFVRARALLAGAGVRVPEVHRTNFERGWMLVEDLGDATLFESAGLEPSTRTGLFLAAVESAARIAVVDATAVAELGSPPLDAIALRRELEPAFEFLLDPHGLAGRPNERRDLLAALDELCDRLGAEPLVPCHRDFMARNLVPISGKVGVIDFQDLRLGPPAYDVASLLNDSFFPDRGLEEELLPERWSAPAAREMYSRAVVQRTIKACGTFARFAARGNPRHVPLIAPTLSRAVPHLDLLPETAAAFGALRQWWTSELGRAAIC